MTLSHPSGRRGELRFLSLCSGIEAASNAWHPLGWRAVGFAEIEAFPSAVLARHYPEIPNYGDITKFKDWPDAAFDLLVGGTPCQSFSVAGLRKGMADPRGNLALTYLAIADRYRPEWLVWENVPGVLSSNGGRDFGAFLGGLGELGYGFAYRVLDAQYVRVDGFDRAVPQRRRRVFVVGNSRDWRRAAAVLFEPESLSGNPAPRREAGEGIAVSPTLRAGGNRTGGDRPPGTDVDTADTLIASTGDVSHCLNAGGMGRIDYETETMIASTLKSNSGGGGFGSDPNETFIPELAKTLTRGAESSGKGGYAGRQQEDDDNLVAFTQNSRSEVREIGGDGSVVGALAADAGAQQQNYISTGWAVRRLTPTECERLQGFPDGYTAISYRGKPAADGPRYKALGNSMAVNVMRWLGRRIELVREIIEQREAA